MIESLFFLPIYSNLIDTTTPGQNEHRSNGDEEVLQIFQSSRTEASPSDDLV